MADRVFQTFLAREEAAGLELAAASDILTLAPLGSSPAQRYIAEFRCRGFCRRGEEIVPWEGFVFGIAFPDDHLRRRDSGALVSLLVPAGCWHANIRFPLLCPGMLPGGTGLVDLLHQVYEIVSYQRYCLTEPMNAEAARWARNHLHLLPADRRPLRRIDSHPRSTGAPDPSAPSGGEEATQR